MRDVTLVILNSLRIKCHIRRPLINKVRLCLSCKHCVSYAKCRLSPTAKQYGLSSTMMESRMSSFRSCYVKRIYGNNVYDLCPPSVTLCSY